MTPEQQAIGALWLFIQAGILGAFKWLAGERDKEKVACKESIADLKIELDRHRAESADVIKRQSEALLKQNDAQAALLAQQQQLISALQEHRRASP